MKPLLSLILILTLNFNTRAQIDTCKHSGLYIDGYKVDKLSCCNFNNLQIVVPYTSEMDKYSFITVWVKYKDYDKPCNVDSGVSFLPRPIFLQTVKKGCLVFTVFNEYESNSELISKLDALGDKVEHSSLNKLMFCETLKAKKVKELSFWVEGLEIVFKSSSKTNTPNDKNGYILKSLSKIYSYKCFYNSNIDCKNSDKGFKLADL